MHRENAEVLDGLCSAHGWPGVFLVGLEGSRTAWVIAQHAICSPQLQRKFLRLLHDAADQGDAPLKQVALLTDRIRFNEGRPQIFGTVLDWGDHGELDCDLDDPETVDQRRAAVGLPPFHEELIAQRNEVKAEGGRPPEDYEAYRAAALAWAKEVGWR